MNRDLTPAEEDFLTMLILKYGRGGFSYSGEKEAYYRNGDPLESILLWGKGYAETPLSSPLSFISEKGFNYFKEMVDEKTNSV
jgi:hypothetical protein